MSRLPDRNMQILLLAIVAFNILPHTLEQPPWLIATSISALLWSGLHIFKGLAYPPKWLRHTLAIAGAAGVFVEWGTIMGQEPATALLVYLAAIKMLESTRYRDAMLIIFTSYFLLMAYLLVNQSLPATLYMAIDVMLITSLMFQLHKSDRRSSFRSFRPVMRLLATALPVWILLFVLFPRFSAGFWSLKTNQNASSGFSDNLDPGSVARLLQSDEPAFRVSFTDGISPRPEDMYWRGAVLHYAEGGLRWSRRGYEQISDQANLKGVGARMNQEIFLEPAYKKWLFALDVPIVIDFEDPIKNGQFRKRAGFIFETNREIGSRVMYQAVSTTLAPSQNLTEETRKLYLQLPPDLSPEVKALADKLKAESDGSTGDIEDKVLRYFEKGGFSYTREPGVMRTGTFDEFLFETKRGFCEHYSAAFSTLMRAAGVPSRVVVGFMGGQINEFGNFVLVRSLDAHAWSEIWNDKVKRWIRVDATAVVAPMRVQLGGDFYGAEQSAYRKTFLYRWQRNLSKAWDAAAMRWNAFLLRYDFDYQQELLRKLGIYAASRMVFFIWASVCVIGFLIGLSFILRRRAKREEPLLAAYHDFCRKMDKAGLPRRGNEGPVTYFARAREFKPENAKDFSHLEDLFTQLRYGPEVPMLDRKRRIKEFRSTAIGLTRKTTKNRHSFFDGSFWSS